MFTSFFSKRLYFLTFVVSRRPIFNSSPKYLTRINKFLTGVFTSQTRYRRPELKYTVVLGVYIVLGLLFQSSLLLIVKSKILLCVSFTYLDTSRPSRLGIDLTFVDNDLIFGNVTVCLYVCTLTMY